LLADSDLFESNIIRPLAKIFQHGLRKIAEGLCLLDEEEKKNCCFALEQRSTSAHFPESMLKNFASGRMNIGSEQITVSKQTSQEMSW